MAPVPSKSAVPAASASETCPVLLPNRPVGLYRPSPRHLPTVSTVQVGRGSLVPEDAGMISTGSAELRELDMGSTDPRGSERREERAVLRSARLLCRASSELAPVSFPNTRTMSTDKRGLGGREGNNNCYYSTTATRD
jgi:hypothetical protein